MIFETENGSVYELQGNKIRRINEDTPLNHDGVWMTLAKPLVLEVGKPATLVLEYKHDSIEDTIVNNYGVTVTTNITQIKD
jgi:hypothetical protein